ncbi:pyridoxal phosphate-dependent transferase [Gaertneriomyces semiglobifer]|nr:pyridoxal phosphate-dependent transferase [Gaertneriomyces semiglobifer]
MGSGTSAARVYTSFAGVPVAPPDPILNLNTLYKADTDPNKINLGVGAYRDDQGKPWVLPVVRKAEQIIFEDKGLDHEYIPIDGIRTFTDASAKLILGKHSPAITGNKFVGVQTISGSGAVRLGAEFLAAYRKAPIYVSKPTWGNHHGIFKAAGFDVREYQYWNPEKKGLALDQWLSTMRSAPNGSIILIHPCAHNPTGVDPTPEEWKTIAQVIKEKGHFPFFDTAYQGFASGDLDRDAWAVRYFVEQGFDMLISQSYSKNMGLYGERTGCLVVVTSDAPQAVAVRSQLCRLQRASISSPPAFGARIVSLILNNEQMFQQWTVELKTMADRIIAMRKALYDALMTLGTPGSWNHITDQIGMFSFTGINVNQVKVLKERYHVYLTDNGRISMAGLNPGNVQRFAEALDWVVRNVN